MSTTMTITKSPEIAATSSDDARRCARGAEGEHPPRDVMLDEVLPLIGVVLVAGPPALIVAGPLMLLALAVCGAFLLIATYVLVAMANAALAAAAVAMPSMMIRGL